LNKPLVILGAGGHAAVLVDALKQQNAEVLGLVSPELDIHRRALQGIPHYLQDDDVLTFSSDDINLVNGLGSLPGNTLREKLFTKFTALGYRFERVIAGSAIISPYAELGHGVQVMPGVIIQAGAVIGVNSIINSGAIIEHDCVIGAHNHIAPGVTISGDVTTGEYVHIGTGASVIQGIKLANNVVVSAGVAVTKNIPAACTVFNGRICMIPKKG
jgi:sugar O-acyltransferase (sialic acid O-acetyltransferase NeuD family)